LFIYQKKYSHRRSKFSRQFAIVTGVKCWKKKPNRPRPCSW